MKNQPISVFLIVIISPGMVKIYCIVIVLSVTGKQCLLSEKSESS